MSLTKILAGFVDTSMREAGYGRSKTSYFPIISTSETVWRVCFDRKPMPLGGDKNSFEFHFHAIGIPSTWLSWYSYSEGEDLGADLDRVPGFVDITIRPADIAGACDFLGSEEGRWRVQKPAAAVREAGRLIGRTVENTVLPIVRTVDTTTKLEQLIQGVEVTQSVTIGDVTLDGARGVNLKMMGHSCI